MTTPDKVFEEFKQAVLGSATEDLTGVYEMWWRANTVHPDWPLSERLAIAERAVSACLDEGLIELFRGEYQDVNLEQPIPATESEATLKDWDTWVVPDGPKVWLSATDAGHRTYRTYFSDQS